MNRVFLSGVALFFAIVGIALLGGQNQATAGHGCCGVVACDGADAGCAATCKGRCFGRLREAMKSRCSGQRCSGTRGKLFAKRRCAGQATDCCGNAVVADCCGTVVADEAAPTEADAQEAPATEEAAPEAPVEEAAE